MKATKRSLIVSIAILCVCAMSLTAASYAWFSASTTAKVSNINLNVAKISDLEISMTPDNKASWTFSIEYAAADSFTDIYDVSTADGINFCAPTEDARKAVDENGALTDPVAYTTASAPLTFTVYFRSREPKTVQFQASKFADTEGKILIAPAMRLAAKVGDTATILADSAANKTYTGLDTSFASQDLTVSYTATDVALLTLSDENVPTEIAKDDGYYYGAATFTYWVEGTDAAAINKNTGYQMSQLLTFSVPNE